MKITQAQKEETLALILDQALQSFLNEGYEQVKLSAISKACHIAEGTLYNYFKDKPTLFIATFIQYRSNNHQTYQLQAPKDFDSLIDEMINILSFYMKIDHPKLESAFKRFLHLVREQKLTANGNMSQALWLADKYIYQAVLELLNSTSLTIAKESMIFNVIVKQVEGVFNDYLYGDIDFEMFISTLRAHLAFILKPYVSF